MAVSQFTLYGVLKGNKPDFHVAMPPQNAKPFYASLVDSFRKSYKPDAVKGVILLALLHELLNLLFRIILASFISFRNAFDLFYGLCACRWCVWSNDEGKEFILLFLRYPEKSL